MASILATIDAARAAAMAGMTITDICKHIDCHRHTARAAVIWAAEFESSGADEGRAAGVAGIEAKARTGCPIMERVER